MAPRGQSPLHPREDSATEATPAWDPPHPTGKLNTQKDVCDHSWGPFRQQGACSHCPGPQPTPQWLPGARSLSPSGPPAEGLCPGWPQVPFQSWPASPSSQFTSLSGSLCPGGPSCQEPWPAHTGQGPHLAPSSHKSPTRDAFRPIPEKWWGPGLQTCLMHRERAPCPHTHTV